MKVSRLIVSFLTVFMFLSSTAFAEEAISEEVSPEVNWVEGGGTVQVGEISSLKLDKSLLYLDKKDTATIQEYIGNQSYDTDIGSVFPVDETQNWFVVFEYVDSGHISDKEKDKIDAKALLKSYKEGTEEANKNRAEEDRLYVEGWHTEPYYNEANRTLIWALNAKDSYGETIINYNVRMLTREGYVSSLLVTDPAKLNEDVQTLQTLILPNYTINDGQLYSNYDSSTDKKSEFGLTGLILGGAGLVAAKKAGLLVAGVVLLKKFWIVLIAIPAALWSWFKRRREAAAARKASLEGPNGDLS